MNNSIILTENQIIKQNHKDFEFLDSLCLKSKNLYNAALFDIRKQYRENGVYLNNYDLIKKYTKEDQFDFRNLPAKVARYTLQLLDQNYSSTFALLKLKNSGKYNKPVRFPKYLDKKLGRQVVHYHKQALSFKKEGYIKLSKTNIFIKTRLKKEQIQFLRLIPRGNHIKVEVGYYKEMKPLKLKKNRYASIDLGLNNLMTVTSTEFSPIIYNGKPLKSINQFYNKIKSNKQSVLQQNNKKYYSNNLQTLSLWRDNQIKNYLHKVTRHLVNYLVKYDIDTVIIGRNKGWKNDISLGKKTNQNFVNIPFSMLYDLLRYKLALEGIDYKEIEESYTSKCSFYDLEDICKHDLYLGKRIRRGLFRTLTGKKVNADINGSLNILRKYLNNINEFDMDLYYNLVNQSYNPKKFNLI